MSEYSGVDIRLLDDALQAMAETLKIAGQRGPVAALEYLGDWMNSRDVVEQGDEEHYDAFTAKLAEVRAWLSTEGLPS